MPNDNQTPVCRVVCETATAIAAQTFRLIQQRAIEAIRQRGRFTLVLAGGSTPEQVYRLLAQSRQDWERWQLFYGDERCLPVVDEQRNSRMVLRSGLADKVALVHEIHAELGAEAAAADYEAVIAAALPFDLVLLGIGEDGHTASLFPGRMFQGGALVIPVHDAPKPPPDRVSLSPRALQSCREMLVLVSGKAKSAALRRWRAGEDLPIARVVAGAPHATVLSDRAAEEG